MKNDDLDADDRGAGKPIEREKERRGETLGASIDGTPTRFERVVFHKAGVRGAVNLNMIYQY